jgi:hypothetical protein
MKKILSLLIVLVPLCGTGLHAQTNTNSFVVPLGTNLTLVPSVPAVTASAVTVDRLIVDNVGNRATIFLHGMPQPIIISGANFTALKAALGPSFKTALICYLQSNSSP